MQFAGKNPFDVGDKEIVVDDQIKILKKAIHFYLEGKIFLGHHRNY